MALRFSPTDFQSTSFSLLNWPNAKRGPAAAGFGAGAGGLAAAAAAAFAASR
jgi:hypothetical protein